MKRASSFQGRVVIALGSGRVVGRVRKLVCDLEAGTLGGILVEGEVPGESPTIGIPAGEIVSIGDDAIMVQRGPGELPGEASEQVFDLLRREIQVYRTGLYTRSGRKVGYLVEPYLDPDRGMELVGFELFSDLVFQDGVRGILLHGEHVQLGQDLILVPDELAGHLVQEDPFVTDFRRAKAGAAALDAALASAPPPAPGEAALARGLYGGLPEVAPEPAPPEPDPEPEPEPEVASPPPPPPEEPEAPAAPGWEGPVPAGTPPPPPASPPEPRSADGEWLGPQLSEPPPRPGPDSEPGGVDLMGRLAAAFPDGSEPPEDGELPPDSDPVVDPLLDALAPSLEVTAEPAAAAPPEPTGDERLVRFVLGKESARELRTADGRVIIRRGEVITEEHVALAQDHEMMTMLFLAASQNG